MKLSLLIPRILINRIGKNRIIKTEILIVMSCTNILRIKYKNNAKITSKMAVEYSIIPNNLGLKL